MAASVFSLSYRSSLVKGHVSECVKGERLRVIDPPDRLTHETMETVTKPNNLFVETGNLAHCNLSL